MKIGIFQLHSIVERKLLKSEEKMQNILLSRKFFFQWRNEVGNESIFIIYSELVEVRIRESQNGFIKNNEWGTTLAFHVLCPLRTLVCDRDTDS